MFKSRTAKRFRAVAIALGITLLTNYAISFAARSGQVDKSATRNSLTEQVDRSGQITNPPTPKPRLEGVDRSGQVTNPPTPKP
jgi:hypothetical protein